MIQNPLPRGDTTDRSHIRLVDEIRRNVAPGPPPTEPPKKDKKKAKKATERTPDAKSKTGTAPDRDGKDKRAKLKGPKPLVKRLHGIQDTLDGLRQRLETLDRAQGQGLSAHAGLGRRLDILEQEVRSGTGRQDALVGRIDTLAQTVSTLEPEPTDPHASALQEIGSGLEQIAERVAKVEARLTKLSEQEDHDDLLAPRLADLEGRIAATARLLETHKDWIERLEQAATDVSALRQDQRTLKEGQDTLATGLDRLREHVDSRVEDLSGEVQQLRTESASERRATGAHLHGLRRDRSIALSLALLAVIAVAGLAWWQHVGAPTPSPALAAEPASGTETPAPTQVTLPPELQTALERITDRLEHLQQTEPSGPLTADLLDRLGRLETGMLDLTRSLAQGDQRGEDLSARLAELIAEQRDLDRRTGELEQQDAGTEQGIALLDARIDRLANDASARTTTKRGDGALVVGASGAYGVQLVVYESSRRIAPFVATHRLGDSARSLDIRIDGRPAHAVMLAPYPSAAQAGAALAELAPDLKALKPWIRPLPPGARLLPVR